MAHVEMGGRANMVGEESQLSRGTGPLAFQPCGGQSGFGGTDGCYLGAPRLDLIGYLFQERSADVAA
jgi:hypothetical protein